jgi:hypothetical protein
MKQYNSYAAVLGPLFDEIPKAVLAAIAVSALTKGGDELEMARVRVADEWRILNESGIVPQKISKSAKLALS